MHGLMSKLREYSCVDTSIELGEAQQYAAQRRIPAIVHARATATTAAICCRRRSCTCTCCRRRTRLLLLLSENIRVVQVIILRLEAFNVIAYEGLRQKDELAL